MTLKDSKGKGAGWTRRGVLVAGSRLATGAMVTPLMGKLAWAADDEASLLAAAKKEGPVMVYSNGDPAADNRLLTAFTKKYGVETQVQRLAGAALAQRLTAETQANVHLADLFMTTDPIFAKDAVGKGWLAPPDGLPALANWPKDGVRDGTVILGVNPYSLAWNTNAIPQGLTDWSQMNDPKYRGRVLLGDPRVLSGAVRTWYIALGRKYGDDFLAQLGTHATYSPSAIPGIQQLAAGAVDIYAPAGYAVTDAMVRGGAPVKQLSVAPVLASYPLANVVGQTPHPNGARLLLNYAMTVEGQSAYDENGYAMLPNVPNTKPRTPIEDIDPAIGDQQLPQLLKLLKLG